MRQKRATVIAHGSFGDVLDPMPIVPPGIDDGIRPCCVAQVCQRIPPGIVYGRGVASGRGVAPPQWLQERKHKYRAKQGLGNGPVPHGSSVTRLLTQAHSRSTATAKAIPKGGPSNSRKRSPPYAAYTAARNQTTTINAAPLWASLAPRHRPIAQAAPQQGVQRESTVADLLSSALVRLYP